MQQNFLSVFDLVTQCVSGDKFQSIYLYCLFSFKNGKKYSPKKHLKLPCSEYLGRIKRIWYLLPMRAAKVQASLRIRAVSPEPSLLAHTSSESRGTFRQEARSLAPLNGWACAVEICHDGMLEDTNSLDAAHFQNEHRCNVIFSGCLMSVIRSSIYLHVFCIDKFCLGKKKKKKVVYTVTCLEKNGSVGWELLFFFFLHPKQMKCTYWLSLCFTSINLVFIREKES